MPVQQSGNVTPGHYAKWVTTNVLEDGGSPPVQERVLGYLNASFNDTNDQPIPIPINISVFCLTRIIVTNASTSLSAAAGGFYSGASKTGFTIVAAAQAYSTLTSAAKLLNPTVTADGTGTRFSASNLTALDSDSWQLFLSLTTGQGAAATADVYLCGFDLTVPGS